MRRYLLFFSRRAARDGVLSGYRVMQSVADAQSHPEQVLSVPTLLAARIADAVALRRAVMLPSERTTVYRLVNRWGAPHLDQAGPDVLQVHEHFWCCNAAHTAFAQQRPAAGTILAPKSCAHPHGLPARPCSEGDRLSGLVADVLGATLVVVSSSRFVELWAP